MLTRLIYSSHASWMMEPKDINNILDASQRFNAKHSITGILCQGNSRFMQCLEGERNVLNELYNRLQKDERHTDLILLNYEFLPQRDFKDWSMGYVSVVDQKVMQVLKDVTGRTDFEPEKLESFEATRLIRGLKKTIYPQITVQIPLAS